MKQQSESTPCVIDVLGEGDDDEEIIDRSLTDGVNTPRSGSPRIVPVGTEPTERPTGAIPTRQSSTPGRDGEKNTRTTSAQETGNEAVRTRLSKPAPRPIKPHRLRR